MYAGNDPYYLLADYIYLQAKNNIYRLRVLLDSFRTCFWQKTHAIFCAKTIQYSYEYSIGCNIYIISKFQRQIEIVRFKPDL